MAKFEEKVEELLSKHPSLTKLEATRIVTEKNERKREKRAAKTIRRDDHKRLHEGKTPEGSAPASSEGDTSPQ